MINVLLVDEHRLFGEAIKSLITTEKDINVIGIATTEPEAIEYITKQQPNIILLDMNLPNTAGLNIAKYTKTNHPKIKLIFLASECEEEPILTALAIGAEGVLLKDLDSQKLIKAIHDTNTNQNVISGPVANMLASKIIELKYSKHDILKRKLADEGINLTDREIDISIMIINKMKNKDIANKLGLGEGTIKNYISELYNKLNLRNRKHVIAYLYGLIPNYYQ